MRRKRSTYATRKIPVFIPTYHPAHLLRTLYAIHTSNGVPSANQHTDPHYTDYKRGLLNHRGRTDGKGIIRAASRHLKRLRPRSR